jgi:hypothetical protein
MEEPLWTQSVNCVSSERLPGAENWALFRDLGSFQRRGGSTNLRVSSEGAEEDEAAAAAAAAVALLLKSGISPPAAGLVSALASCLPRSAPAGWAQRTHRRAASPLRRTRAARLSPPSGISTNTWWVFLFSYRNDSCRLRGGRRCPRVCCALGSGESSHTRQAGGGGACMVHAPGPRWPRRRRSPHVLGQRPRRGRECGRGSPGHPGATVLDTLARAGAAGVATPASSQRARGAGTTEPWLRLREATARVEAGPRDEGSRTKLMCQRLNRPIKIRRPRIS